MQMALLREMLLPRGSRLCTLERGLVTTLCVAYCDCYSSSEVK